MGAPSPEEPGFASRIVPVQGRAQQRVTDILDATQELLEEDAKVTTSSIAERADIPVGSVYRYFPNIDSVYLHLFARLSNELRDRLVAVLSHGDGDKHWRDTLDEALSASLRFIEENTAYGRLQFGLSTPALQAIEHDAVDFLSAIVADRWKAGEAGFHGGNVLQVALVTSGLFSFVERCHYEAVTGDGSSPSLVDEAVKALYAYLSQYLED